MSLQWSLSRVIPADTAAIGQAVLKSDNVYRQIGEHFDEIFPPDSAFSAMYDPHGRGAIPPLLAALVTVCQMLERVPDRQAAAFVASRLDWKYALHLPLAYPGFHFTDLLAFRQRLWDHAQERLLFEQLLTRLQALGTLKPHGKLRTDSTHVLALVERLSQLELVGESLRVALQAVSDLAPQWIAQALPASFQEAYAVRQSAYRLRQAEVQRRLAQAGRDGFWFLAQLDGSAPAAVRDLPEVATLRTVLAQQFPGGPDQPPAQKRPVGEGVIESPHEPDARLSSKRGQSWIGYKSQLTETCDADRPHLIVDIAPTSALAHDAPQLPAIQQRLAAQGLVPTEQQVDQGYISGEHIATSAKRGTNLVGPPPQDTHLRPGFQQVDFVIDELAQQATCPQGQVSRSWRPQPDPAGEPPTVVIRFRGAQCRACPAFGHCTRNPKGRSLELHPYRDVLQARRAEAATDSYRHKMHLRAGIEATISELVRTHGLRRARYRGAAKQRLQQVFTAVAVNLKRLAHWWARPAAQATEPAA